MAQPHHPRIEQELLISASTKQMVQRQRSDIPSIGAYGEMSVLEMYRLARMIDGDIFNKDGACALWTGYMDPQRKGAPGQEHGRFYYRAKKVRVTRILYHNFVDDIDPSLLALHGCQSNGRCCALAHLRMDTTKENSAQRVREQKQTQKRKSVAVTADADSPPSETQPNVLCPLLTTDEERAVLDVRAEEGMSVRSTAQLFGISCDMVRKICLALDVREATVPTITVLPHILQLLRETVALLATVVEKDCSNSSNSATKPKRGAHTSAKKKRKK